MASSPQSDNQPHALPYCADPNCQSCKELREVQESIRLHRPIPNKKSQ
jgi:hypothetical protein